MSIIIQKYKILKWRIILNFELGLKYGNPDKIVIKPDSHTNLKPNINNKSSNKYNFQSIQFVLPLYCCLFNGVLNSFKFKKKVYYDFFISSIFQFFLGGSLV